MKCSVQIVLDIPTIIEVMVISHTGSGDKQYIFTMLEECQLDLKSGLMIQTYKK